MYINLQVVLWLVIGAIVLTFALALYIFRMRKRPEAIHYSPDLIPMKEKFDDGIIAVRTIAQPQPKTPLQTQMKSHQQQNIDVNLISSLGLAKADPIFAELESNNNKNFVEETERKITPKAHSNDKLMVINIFAQPGQKFQGYELLQSLLSVGLRYGKMSIFHRHEQANGNGAILFSLASATEPGIFDMNKMGAFTCTGLSVFMRLEGPQHTLAALDLMIETAKQLTEELGGILKDGQRQDLSETTINQFREQVRKHQTKLSPSITPMQTRGIEQ